MLITLLWFYFIYVDFYAIFDNFSQKFLASLTNFSEASSQNVF